jgi:aquaporin Z
MQRLPAAFKAHWPEYLIEACGLGAFMIAAGLFGALLEYPGSPARQALPDPLIRRALMGMAMGLTSIAIVYSPWGKRSGAHINPSVTLSFWRLGKVEGADAVFYVLAQFAGAAAGLALVAAVIARPLADPLVNYVATVPGLGGPRPAFLAEAAISFLLMLTVLAASNTRALARFTGLMAGALVALYITIESPISGMSMNPARSFGSALSAGLWTSFWIYLTAPPLAMIAAAEAFGRLRGARDVWCAKLHHDNDQRCIFRCNYPMPAARRAQADERGRGRGTPWSETTTTT